MVYTLIRKFIGTTVDGWTFLNISIWFIGGLQMLSLGIIGEYIGKIYGESKRRPRYCISENLIDSRKNVDWLNYLINMELSFIYSRLTYEWIISYKSKEYNESIEKIF